MNTELHEARETIARLNRRAQAAEAAMADLLRCNEIIRSGKAWCGGSLGRAFLAYENSRLHKFVMSLADRVAAQSELLSQRSERREEHGPLCYCVECLPHPKTDTQEEEG